MRIGQYTDTFLPVVDGVGRVVVSYAQTMGDMGHDVTVFAPKAEMGDLSTAPYNVITYNAITMPGKMPYRIGIPPLDIRFEKKLHDTPLDIIHVHSPFIAGYAGLHAAKRRGIPIVGSFHSKYYDDFSLTLKSEFLAKGGVKIVVDFYEQCDEVWAVSRTTADTLLEYGYRGHVHVMPNGADIRTLDSAVLPELRTRFALETDTPVLLYVGQLNWKKNIHRTLEAAVLLMRQDVPFRLILAGQGPHEEDIRQAVQEMNLESRVAFAGHITDTRILDGLYSLASFLVFPSLYDNAPMVLREAAAMRTPAILIAGSNAAEAISPGENGLTCEDTADSLAAALQAGLALSESERERMGQAARETIPVPWTTLMENVLDRYANLVRNPTVPL